MTDHVCVGTNCHSMFDQYSLTFHHGKIYHGIASTNYSALLRKSQELKPGGVPNRHRISVWAIEKRKSAIFYQNFRIWAEKQPEEVQELPLHSVKTNVWCGL